MDNDTIIVEVIKPRKRKIYRNEFHLSLLLFCLKHSWIRNWNISWRFRKLYYEKHCQSSVRGWGIHKIKNVSALHSHHFLQSGTILRILFERCIFAVFCLNDQHITGKKNLQESKFKQQINMVGKNNSIKWRNIWKPNKISQWDFTMFTINDTYLLLLFTFLKICLWDYVKLLQMQLVYLKGASLLCRS